jgi:molybdate transport system substrate-binding protein
LREAFAALGEQFQREHPGVEVLFNLGGSQELRLQIEHGAHADVFASADLLQIDQLEQQGLVRSASVFARNRPVLVVPATNPAGIDRFEDIQKARRIILAAPEVPIGRYSAVILEKAAQQLGPEFLSRVSSRVVSRELNVRQVLAKVALGEADAGIVYRTDAQSAGDRVRAISIPDEHNVVAQYAIAEIEQAPRSALAETWIRLVLSPAAQGVLRQFGFSAGQPDGRP